MLGDATTAEIYGEGSYKLATEDCRNLRRQGSLAVAALWTKHLRIGFPFSTPQVFHLALPAPLDKTDQGEACMKAARPTLHECIGERFHVHYRFTGDPRDVVTSGEIYRVLWPLPGRCPKLDINQWLSRRLRAYVNAGWTLTDRRGVYGHGRGDGGCRVFCGLQRRGSAMMGAELLNLRDTSCDLLLFAVVASEVSKQPSVLSGKGRPPVSWASQTCRATA